MSKRAFLVVGPEGSGTNLLAEAFVSAGCHYEPKHNSHLDDYEFRKMPDTFVFRRSLPHAGVWPYLDGLVWQMEAEIFAVRPIIILRDWHCTIQSVLRRDSKRYSGNVENNMRRALCEIGTMVKKLPIYVSYESFCLHPEFRRWLFVERLGLKEPTIEIKYANLRYYEKGEDYIKGHMDWPEYKYKGGRS